MQEPSHRARSNIQTLLERQQKQLWNQVASHQGRTEQRKRRGCFYGSASLVRATAQASCPWLCPSGAPIPGPGELPWDTSNTSCPASPTKLVLNRLCQGRAWARSFRNLCYSEKTLVSWVGVVQSLVATRLCVLAPEEGRACTATQPSTQDSSGTAVLVLGL